MVYKVDFDDLVCRADVPGGNLDAQNNLWGNVFALPEWFFVRRGHYPKFYPYFAGDPDVAGGKAMVRAFTDTERLFRFAEEEDFLIRDADSFILKLPTQTILDYLEKLVPRGVYGIWFNSDTQSEGFYGPIVKLRGIKSFLREIGWILP